MVNHYFETNWFYGIFVVQLLFSKITGLVTTNHKWLTIFWSFCYWGIKLFYTNSFTNPISRRTGPSGQEEWVGNSLVQKGGDDLYTVTDTLYNSAISNAKIDVRFFNETDSSQSTLTVENVETDYDNLFNYFCKVQFNDPDQGMIADLKASDEESFEVFGKSIFFSSKISTIGGVRPMS